MRSSDEFIEVVESDWVSADVVALRLLPAIIQRDGDNASATVREQVEEAYCYADAYVQYRSRRQKEEYEEAEAGYGQKKPEATEVAKEDGESDEVEIPF